MFDKCRMRNFGKLHIFWKIYLSTLCLLVIYNEYLIHIFHSLQWSQLECQTDRCLKILLVADPQILGNTFDKKLYWPLANLDSDWHLSKTYRKALQHTTPDVICFLGDLMDEGSVASAVQYDEYYARFANIFPQPKASTLMIYIPGDNDIGGEGRDQITEENVRRFRQYFDEQPTWELTTHKAKFFNVNRFTGFMPPTDDISWDSESYSIMLSHMSLLKNANSFSERAIDVFRPQIIFSAHDHVSKMAVVHKSDRNKRNEISSFNLVNLRYRQELLEIMVPTCSYRMGVMKIGYGYAVLDGDELKYTVLWTSQRFYQLAIYSLMIIPLKLLCGQIWCVIFKRYWCCCRSRNRNYLPLPIG
ncbi:uncharacterized protein LOC5564483 isoform X2 [Aedes aegypti]|uniref:Calcineurin-like phosphoesterase domain-containing protein n=1 Tax=Aedes aegypti TaxID=7159 RepID=A0A6I8T6Z5_AEDAE|nr:uncharacterized protein LOC5564483 isoform X2 [Aedes aegypti]